MKKGIICITGFLLLILMVGVAGACTVQRTDIQANNALSDTDGGPWGHHGSSWAFSKFSELLLETKAAAGDEDISPRQFRRHHRHFGHFSRLDASIIRWWILWNVSEYFNSIQDADHSSSSTEQPHAPVPASLLLLASGLVGLVGYRRTISK